MGSVGVVTWHFRISLGPTSGYKEGGESGRGPQLPYNESHGVLNLGRYDFQGALRFVGMDMLLCDLDLYIVQGTMCPAQWGY